MVFAYMDPDEGSRLVQAFIAGAGFVGLIVLVVALLVLVLRKR